VLRNADYALDAAHDATDSAAYDGPDCAANWSGGAMAYGHAVPAAPNDALGLSGDRRRERGDDDGCCELRFHERSSLADCVSQRMGGLHSAIMASEVG
jgi:hypothetical protein